MKNSTKYGVSLIAALSLLILSILALSTPSHNIIKLANNSSSALSNSSHNNIRPVSDSSQNDIKSVDSAQDIIKPANKNKPSNETIHLASSALIVPVTHEDLSNLSDTIVIGTVKEIHPSRWNSIDGKQPNKPVDELDQSNLIYSDIIISADKYLKNPLSSKEVTVRVVGGTVGNISMGSADEPSFESGEKILLYLYKDNDPNLKNIDPEHFRVTGSFQGKFTLTDDKKAVRPDENVSLDELLSTIKK